jgi:hypothetical protein
MLFEITIFDDVNHEVYTIIMKAPRKDIAEEIAEKIICKDLSFSVREMVV